jgi:hypothetical protein
VPLLVAAQEGQQRLLEFARLFDARDVPAVGNHNERALWDLFCRSASELDEIAHLRARFDRGVASKRHCEIHFADDYERGGLKQLIREGRSLGPARVFSAERDADLHLRERVGKLAHRIREVARLVSRSRDQAIEPQN